MAGLMDLFITIGVEDDASDKIKSITGSIGKGLATAAKVGAAAVAAVGAGAVALGKALVTGASQVAVYGDNIDKMSQKMGITAKSYQEWDFILQHCGASIDSMQRGMMTLTLAAENGSDAFAALGMSQEEVASMSQDELFSATIKGLQGIEDSGERAALAQKLLGASAKELGPLLNMSAEDTEAMRQQVNDLGGVMSDEAVAACAQFQDSLLNLQTAFGGLKNKMMVEFLPSMSKVMDGMTAIFSGDKAGGMKMITEGVHEITEQISQALPELIEMASEILVTIIEVVAENLPDIIRTLIPVLINAVIDIIGILIQNLPAILEALWDAIKTVAQELWPVLQSAFGSIGEWFKGIFEAAKEKVKEAFRPVGEFFSDLWEKIKEVWNDVKEFFSGIFGPAADAISTAFGVIQDAASKAAEWITSVFQPVADFFSGLAGTIKSIWEYGNNVGEFDWASYGGMPNAIGNDYVPYDGYRAILHKGEAVLTAREAEEWRRGEGSKGVENVFNFYGVSQSDLEMIADYVNGALA